MSVFETSKRKEDTFFDKLSGLLDAGPEQAVPPGRKKRRVEDIVSEVCEYSGDINEAKTQPVRPWVYDDYLVRLRTFKASTWFAMPPEISPLECARLGWTNSGPSTLKCLACGIDVVHSADMNAADFRARLSVSHESYCGWGDNPSTETFCTFQIDSTSAVQEKFTMRASSLLKAVCGDDSAVVSALENVLLQQVDNQGMRNQILRLKPSDVSARITARSSVISILDDGDAEIVGADIVLEALRQLNPVTFPLILSCEGVSAATSCNTEFYPEWVQKNKSKVLKSILTLTVFGWTIQAAGDCSNCVAELCCDTCGRSVPLTTTGTPIFNGINQHRFFCPWVAGTEMHPCGWEVYASSVFESKNDCGKGEPVIAVARDDNACSIFVPDSTTPIASLVGSNRPEPVAMFKKIQSVMTLLSGTPYNISHLTQKVD